MAINYATLFTTLGKIFYAAKLENRFRGGVAADDRLAEYEDVLDQFDGVALDLQDARADFTGSAERAARGGDWYLDALKTLAQATVIYYVNADNQQPDDDLGTALRELVVQMTDDSESIELQTPTITPSYDTGNGSGNDYGAVVTLTDGKNELREYSYAEDIVVRFTSQNSWIAEGEPAAPSLTHEDYPGGSGGSLSGSAAEGGLLSNADFETWGDTTTPGTWTVVVGTWTQETTTIYKGLSVAKITGDAATKHEIEQAVTGLETESCYAWKLSLRLSGVPAAGVLTIGLYYDDDNSDVLDEAGAAQEYDIDLTAESSGTWVHKQGVFRTAEPLNEGSSLTTASNIVCRIHCSTAVSNTIICYIDDVGLVKMEEVYAGGPLVAFFVPDLPWSTDDVITLAVVNAWGSEMAKWCSSMLDLREEGYRLPSHASPTRADTLIA